MAAVGDIDRGWGASMRWEKASPAAHATVNHGFHAQEIWLRALPSALLSQACPLPRAPISTSDATLDPGAYVAQIRASGLAGGVYFYRLAAAVWRF